MVLTLFKIFLDAILISASAQAADYDAPFFNESSTRISGIFCNYGGSTDATLSSNSVGYGVELQARKGNSYFSIVTGARFVFVQGIEEFADGTSTTQAGFNLYMSDALVGFQFSLLPSSDLSLRPYFGANGLGSFVQTKLEDKTYHTLKKSEAQLGTGYELVVGVDYMPDRKIATENTKSTSYSIEARLRTATFKILNQDQFKIEGVDFAFGLGF